jgi:hypothetical protein
MSERWFVTAVGNGTARSVLRKALHTTARAVEVAPEKIIERPHAIPNSMPTTSRQGVHAHPRLHHDEQQPQPQLMCSTD